MSERAVETLFSVTRDREHTDVTVKCAAGTVARLTVGYTHRHTASSTERLILPSSQYMRVAYTRCGKISNALKLFAVFSATAWHFSVKFCMFM